MTSKRKFTALVAIPLICIILTARIPFQRFVNPTVYPPPEGAATRIFLLGDSIARQYFDALAEKLPADTILTTLRAPRPQTLVERLRSPVDEMVNARDSSQLLEAVRAWMPLERFDTILINAGLHDLNRNRHGHEDPFGSRESRFRRNLREVVSLLRPRARRVCFVATTQTASSAASLPRDEIDVLNRIAREVTSELGIHFIDLQWPPDADSMFLEDGVHLNSRGVDHVASSIAADLERLGRSDGGSPRSQ
jgi:lysophospholipase L1-like esterase